MISRTTDEATPTREARLPRAPSELPPRVRRAILALVAAMAACGALGTAFSPFLLVEHPLWLVGLNPDSRHLVLAAARAELWQVALVAVPRRTLSFLATYGVGSLYGYALIEWMERRGRLMCWLVHAAERLYLRIGLWLVVLVPLYSVAGLAGIGRMRARTYAVAILPGQVAFVLITLLLGDALAPWTEPFIAWLGAHVVEATAACVIAVVGQQAWSRWRKRRSAQSRSGT